MKLVVSLAVAGVVTLSTAGVAQAGEVHPSHAVRAAAAVGQINIVQAVPDDSVSVTIDGRDIRSVAPVGSVLGPYTLSVGSHQVGFVNSSGAMSVMSTLTVKPGSSSDVVLHRPAAVGGAPVVSAYATPTTPIGPGRARILVAHTATVAPADVRVDGKVVFRNIANGEYATADVAAGKHVVALLPTGVRTHPILGPIDLSLKAQTVTMVYAVGNPKNRSMSVIAHVVTLRSDGSKAPDTIDTGSAGLAAGVHVTPFSGGGPVAGTTTASRDGWLLAGLLGALMVPAAAGARRRRTTRGPARV